MLEKLNQLSFIIGAFFILVAIILLGGYILSSDMKQNINLYTGIGLMIFGLFMINIKASE